MRHLSNFRTWFAAALAAGAIGTSITTAPAASAHEIGPVKVYTPLMDADSSHDDYVARWNITGERHGSHHRVYRGYGYRSDISMDIYAEPGTFVVTPFASRTQGGDRVISKVIAVRPGCASGRVSDGGYVVQVEAINSRTGRSLGIASLMHVNRPRVRVGQHLGGWTKIGTLSEFNLSSWSSCYQVSRRSGVHLHLELVTPSDYACMFARSAGFRLTELTQIGWVGKHYRHSGAAC